MHTTMGRQTVSRRTLLYGSAAAAGAVMLGGCSGGGDGGAADSRPTSQRGKGSVTEALPPPKKYAESPALAQRVEDGDLPPVEERLPEKPYVIPHRWFQQGKYGGTIRTMVRASDDGVHLNWFYGSSPMRFLNDGLDITGGLVETWDQNNDASEWTFHFRKGLKWSDGEPFTVDDILFWWEDMLLNPDHEEVPPDELRSGSGTLAELRKEDDHTLKMTFDAPTPLTAERMATWANGHPGAGPRWIVPSHYARRFHPKYNKEVDKDWAAPDGLFAQKLDIIKNPECPTMNAWQVVTYSEGRQVIWERNPYCYSVSPEGDQLPYIDQIIWNVNPETKVGKIDVYQGKVDLQMGQHYEIELLDVEELDNAAEDAGIERILIDSGSGTGSQMCCTLDHRDPKYRELFNTKEFRQALSHAIDRKRIQKSVYYNTGQRTTGTLSPKAMEYVVNDEGKRIYEQWRDAYVDHDPKKAESLLDKAGLPKGSDGIRTFEDGTEFKFIMNFPSDIGEEHRQKNNIIKENLEAVGLQVVLDPINPDSYGAQWNAGKLDVKAEWHAGDGPNHLLYPQWMVPISNDRWAPLQGQWYALRGTKGAESGVDNENPWNSKPPRREPEANSPVDQMFELYDRTKTEPDEMKRVQLVWDIIKLHIEHGPFFIGTVADFPRVVVKKSGLRNVPTRENLAQGGMADPSIHPTPGVYDPESFFWSDPEQQSS